MSRPTDAEYCEYDPFLDCDRDVNIRNCKVRIVTTRKEHPCAVGNHHIARGMRVRLETAFVDGRPGKYYACLTCLDARMRG